MGVRIDTNPPTQVHILTQLDCARAIGSVASTYSSEISSCELTSVAPTGDFQSPFSSGKVASPLGPKDRYIQFDAKVVDKKLIIKRIDSLIADLRKDVFAEVQLLDCRFASHACASMCLPNIALFAMLNLLEPRISGRPVSKDSSYSTMLLHCTECATDLKITASPAVGREDTVRMDVVS